MLISKEIYQKVKKNLKAKKEAMKAEERRNREQALLKMIGRASDLDPGVPDHNR